MLGLFDLELAVVKVELLALENVAVSATGLTGTRGDDGEQTTGLELLLEQRVELGSLFALVEDALDVVGLLGVGVGLGELSTAGSGLSVLQR